MQIYKLSNITRKDSKIKVVAFAVTGVILVLVGILLFVTKIFDNTPKGTVVLNTNKATYLPSEKVDLYMTALDHEGNSVCDGKLKITIKDLKGNNLELASSDKKILTSATCSETNNFTNESDYLAQFAPTETGTYEITLVDIGTKATTKTQIEVVTSQKFSLERKGAMKMPADNSTRNYMLLKITSKEDFKGQVVDHIPATLNIVWQGQSKVTDGPGDQKTITWEVDLKAGETKEYVYEYQKPATKETTNTNFFTFGKAAMIENGQKVFEEGSFWQISGVNGSN